MIAPLVLAAFAAAQQPQDAAVRLTIDEALDRARTTSARIGAQREMSRAASAQLDGARASLLPVVDAAGAYSRNSNVPELILQSPGAPPRTIFPNLPDQFRTRVGVTVPIYTGGRLRGLVDAARDAERAAEFDVASARGDVETETRTAFVQALLADETARVVRESLGSFDAHLKDARNRADLGLVAGHEVLAVTAERERADFLRVQAEHFAEVARAALLRLVGLPAATRLELAPLPAPVVSEAVAREVLVASALAQRPELEALRARIRGGEAQAKVARAASLPSAAVQAGYDLANPNPRVMPLTGEWKGTWSVGVGLQWNAFDGGRTRANAATADALVAAARAQLRDLEERVRFDVASRALALDTARASVGMAARSLEAARAAVVVARDRYREGVGSSTDLLDAETRELRAALEQSAAVSAIHLAQALLDRAVFRGR